MRLQRRKRIRISKSNKYIKVAEKVGTRKIEWLAVLQGFSMLLVVIGHVSLTNQPGDPSTPIASGIEWVIYSFHMPLFISISGWLFYYTCLGRDKHYKDVLASKAKRLLIPFFVFTIVTMLLKAAFPELMHRVVDAQELIDTFVFFRSNPLGEMWFIIVLFELMLLYPLYKFMTKNKVTAVLGLIIAILLNTFTLPLSYFNLQRVAYMLPFFVAGILCSKYEWQIILGNVWAFLLAGCLFLVCNVYSLIPNKFEIITVTAGIAFSISLCINVAKILPNLFSSYRDYTFQIFLMGIFFQMAIRWIYVKNDNEMLFIPMWILSVLVGVYTPTFIAKLVKKYAPNALKMCFGL